MPKYYHLRYYDIYKGLRLNQIGELNFIIRYLLSDRLCADFNLRNPDYFQETYNLSPLKLKDSLIIAKEVNLKLIKAFKLLKSILSLLSQNNIPYVLHVELSGLSEPIEPNFRLELPDYYSTYIRNMKNHRNITDIDIEPELIEIQKLIHDALILSLHLNFSSYNYYFTKLYQKDPIICYREMFDSYLTPYMEELAYKPLTKKSIKKIK